MASLRTRWLTAGAAALVVALILTWPAVASILRGTALDLYRLSGTLNAALAGPVTALRSRTGVSLLTPFLLGLLAATAPCQLSTGAATVAYSPGTAMRVGPGRAAWPSCPRACWCTSFSAPWPCMPLVAL